MKKEKFKSIQAKLFKTITISIAIIIVLLILINSLVLETFYLYRKKVELISTFSDINEYLNNVEVDEEKIRNQEEIKKIALKNNFDILIKSDNDLIIFSLDKDAVSTIDEMLHTTKNMKFWKEPGTVIYQTDRFKIQKVSEKMSNLNYLMLSGELDNGYTLYIRVGVTQIQESVRISNNLLIFIGIITIIVSGISASVIAKKFTKPILELNDVTNKMANLNFNKKYNEIKENNEINELGRNINQMSSKLESVIGQLRNTNIELEKDIEEKSKIDEMRKQFISDVSHELKTPIALIQGYAEGLVENVNSDEESKKFYAEVILDETNKMDKLVKELLELMKLEYGKREFNDVKINLYDIVKENIRKYEVLLNENSIKLNINIDKNLYINFDELAFDQIFTNYITNAIKHVKEINSKKEINIYVINNNNIRLNVYNTGKQLQDEEIERIWKRFYKVDSSRNRQDGGTGIGLSIVKAIMTHYQNDYGVINKDDGVEFYFDMSKTFE